MKFKITIEKVYDKQVKEKNWLPTGRQVPDDDPQSSMRKMKTEYDYKEEFKTKEVEETIYEQTRESEIDLMAVIEAFNKNKETK